MLKQEGTPIMRKLLFNALLMTTFLPLSCSEEPKTQLENSIENLRTFYTALDIELKRLARPIAIPTSVITFLATFKAVQRALPDDGDKVIPALVASGASYGVYKLSEWLSPKVLLTSLMKKTVTPWITPKKSLDNIALFKDSLANEITSLEALNATQNELIERSNKESDSCLRQLLIDCTKK